MDVAGMSGRGKVYKFYIYSSCSKRKSTVGFVMLDTCGWSILLSSIFDILLKKYSGLNISPSILRPV
jgi:hypothetical protein